jgi:hypothetical protein
LSSGSTMADKPVPVRRRLGAAASTPPSTAPGAVPEASVRSSLDSLTKGPSQGAGVGLRRPVNPVVRYGGGAEPCSTDHDGVVTGNIWVHSQMVGTDCSLGSPIPPRPRLCWNARQRKVAVSGSHVRGADTTCRPAWRCVADEHKAPSGASGASLSLTSPGHTAIPWMVKVACHAVMETERAHPAGPRSVGVRATHYPLPHPLNRSVMLL